MNAEENKQSWETPEIIDLDVMETKGKLVDHTHEIYGDTSAALS